MRKILCSRFVLSLAFVIQSGIITAQQSTSLPVRNTAKKTLPVIDQLSQKEKNWYTRQVPPPARVVTDALGGTDVLVNNNNGTNSGSRFTQSGSSVLAFGNNVVVAFNDAGSIAAGSHVTGYAYSSDGGASFTDGGNLPNSAEGDGGLPVLARNSTTGRIYLATVGFTTGNMIQVFRSDDNGVTWLIPVNSTAGGAFESKPWIAVDNFPGPGNGNVYVVSRRFEGIQGLYLSRSTDHGTTWFLPIQLAPVGELPQGGFIAIGPDHTVYVFWYDDTNNIIKVRKSTDGGITFSSPSTVATGVVAGVNGDLGLTGIRQGTASPAAFRTNGFPHAAVNPVSGHLYVTYARKPAGVDKADIFLVKSQDLGLTWSAPERVNDDCTTTDQWFPTIAVTPDGLNLGLFYYSREEDPANNLFRYCGRIAAISGINLNFQPSTAISDVQSFPEMGRDIAFISTFAGDYNTAVATASGFAVAWSDNRDDLPGGAPRKDPNIYFSSFAIPPATCIPPVVSAPTVTQPTCPVPTGTIVVNATGAGTLEYSVTGTAGPFQLSNTFSGLLPGTYEIIVRVQGSPECRNDCSTPNVTIIPSNVTISTFSYTGPPVAIPDNNITGVNITLPVSGLLTDLVDINFRLDAGSGTCDATAGNTEASVDHTFLGDLEFKLTSPTGTTVTLISRRGSGGNNFCTVLLDDDGGFPAASTIPTTGAVSGSFAPESSLSAFDNQSGNGNWVLNVNDNVNTDFGNLRRFSLIITTATPCPGPDLSITKTDSPDPVSAGNNLTYTITVQNSGPADATNLSLADNLPANTSFVSLTAPGGWTSTTPAVGSTGTITATKPILTVADGPQVFTLVVQVDPATVNGTIISNTASVTATETDPNLANNTDTETTNVSGGICTPSTTVTDDPAFPGGTALIGVSFGPGTITIDHVNAPPGLQSITVFVAENVDVVTPPFVVGTFNPVTITYTIINPALPYRVYLRASNGVNAVFVNVQCPPILDPCSPGNDNIPPSITCPAPITIQCASQVPAPNPASVIATDNCPGLVTITFVGDVITDQTCPNRFTVTRTYRATDASNNSANCTQTITVFDNTPPTITACPANITVQCASEVPAPNPAFVSATDNCGGTVVVTFLSDVITNQTCANRFTVTRTYRATDACGNSAECTQTITVNDQTAPTLTCPANATVSCASQVPAANIALVTGVSDNCSGTVTVTHVGDVITNQTCANRFTLTRTYRATDVCGNFAECTQIFTVNDQTAPTLICPANATVSCASQVPAANITLVTGVSDNCSGTVTVTHVGDVITNQTCANRFTLTRTYRATDVCGNFAECTQIFTVNDQTAPTLTCPANATVSCASQVPAANIALVTGVSDNCSGTVTVTHVGDVITNQTCANRFTLTRTYRATDVCGNFAECTQVFTVNDQTAPVITCPSNMTVTTPVGSCVAVVNFTVTATDNCGGAVTINSVPASGSSFPIGTTTVTSTATDLCGNISTCTFTVTVLDGQLPVITTQPVNRTVCTGTTATFSVVSTNAVTYQWQQFIAGVWTNVTGATGASFTVASPVQSMNTNTFRVNVIGLCTTVPSAAATLFVNPLPTISLTSSNSPVLLPGQTTSIVANVNPAGGTFAWFKNGQPRTPTVTTGTLSNLGVDDNGTYYAVYTDLNGCVATSANLVINAEASDILFVAPNPNFGQFWVRYYNPLNEPLTVIVYDSKGARVNQQTSATTLPYTQINVNMKVKSGGVYLVELRGADGRRLGAKRIIVGAQ